MTNHPRSPRPFEQLAELLKEAGALPVLEVGGFKIVLDSSLPENEIRMKSGGSAAKLVNLALTGVGGSEETDTVQKRGILWHLKARGRWTRFP